MVVNDRARPADMNDCSELLSHILKTIAVVLAPPVAVGLSYATRGLTPNAPFIIAVLLILNMSYCTFSWRLPTNRKARCHVLRLLFLVQHAIAIFLILITPSFLSWSCLGLLLLVVVSVAIFFVLMGHVHDKRSEAFLLFSLLMFVAMVWNSAFWFWHWLNSLD